MSIIAFWAARRQPGDLRSDGDLIPAEVRVALFALEATLISTAVVRLDFGGFSFPPGRRNTGAPSGRRCGAVSVHAVLHPAVSPRTHPPLHSQCRKARLVSAFATMDTTPLSMGGGHASKSGKWKKEAAQLREGM